MNSPAPLTATTRSGNVLPADTSSARAVPELPVLAMVQARSSVDSAFAEAGLTLSVATAPAVTVSVCVALVRPGALAVIVGAPAFRSR